MWPPLQHPILSGGSAGAPILLHAQRAVTFKLHAFKDVGLRPHKRVGLMHINNFVRFCLVTLLLDYMSSDKGRFIVMVSGKLGPGQGKLFKEIFTPLVSASCASSMP